MNWGQWSDMMSCGIPCNLKTCVANKLAFFKVVGVQGEGQNEPPWRNGEPQKKKTWPTGSILWSVHSVIGERRQKVQGRKEGQTDEKGTRMKGETGPKCRQNRQDND